MNDKVSRIKYGTDRNPFENSYADKNREMETENLKKTGHVKKISALATGMQMKLQALQDEVGGSSPNRENRRGKTNMILGSAPSEVSELMQIKQEYEDGLLKNAQFKAKFGNVEIKKNIKGR
jgi:hypothetical protein